MTNQKATAYINAGGRGSRLWQLFTPTSTLGVTKALLELGEPKKSLIEFQIMLLRSAGFQDIVIGAGDHQIIGSYLDQKKLIDTHLHVITSIGRNGTGGDLIAAIRTHPELFSSEIFVLNVDTLIEIDGASMLHAHRKFSGLATIALSRRDNLPNAGAYSVNERNQIAACEETSPPIYLDDEKITFKASSTGIVIFNREWLANHNLSQSGTDLSIYSHIMREVIEARRAYAYDNGTCFFMDVGTIDSWQFALANIQQLNPILHF